MAGFPKKNLQASAYLAQENAEADYVQVSYLRCGGKRYFYSNNGQFGECFHISEMAKRADFADLSQPAREYFQRMLSTHGLNDQAHGLRRYPDWIEVDRQGLYIIFQSYLRRPRNPVRVQREGQEVWKGQSLNEAYEWIGEQSNEKVR